MGRAGLGQREEGWEARRGFSQRYRVVQAPVRMFLDEGSGERKGDDGFWSPLRESNTGVLQRTDFSGATATSGRRYQALVPVLMLTQQHEACKGSYQPQSPFRDFSLLKEITRQQKCQRHSGRQLASEPKALRGILLLPWPAGRLHPTGSLEALNFAADPLSRGS